MKNRFARICLATSLTLPAATLAQSPPASQIAQLQNMSLADLLQVDIGTADAVVPPPTQSIIRVALAFTGSRARSLRNEVPRYEPPSPPSR